MMKIQITGQVAVIDSSSGFDQEDCIDAKIHFSKVGDTVNLSLECNLQRDQELKSPFKVEFKLNRDERWLLSQFLCDKH